MAIVFVLLGDGLSVLYKNMLGRFQIIISSLRLIQVTTVHLNHPPEVQTQLPSTTHSIVTDCVDAVFSASDVLRYSCVEAIIDVLREFTPTVDVTSGTVAIVVFVFSAVVVVLGFGALDCEVHHRTR
jgi:hypothetical protein